MKSRKFDLANADAKAGEPGKAVAQQCDFAIIGAGFSGIAAADALSRKFPACSVVLFDAGFAEGGCARSVQLTPWLTPVETGPEYIRQDHRRFRAIAAAVGVQLQPISYALTRYFLREQAMSGAELKERAAGLYHLAPEECGHSAPGLFARALRAAGVDWAKLHALQDRSGAGLAYLRSITLDGRGLGDHTLERVVSKHLSCGAAAYVADALGAGDAFSAGDAAITLDTLAAETNAAHQFYCAPMGLQEIARRWLARCRGRVAVRFGHKLVAVEGGEETCRLRFATPAGVAAVDAAHTIVATPAQALRAIAFGAGVMPASAGADLAALESAPALKFVIAYDARWWTSFGGAPPPGEVRACVTDTPLQLVNLRGDRQTGAVIVSVLARGAAAAFWSHGLGAASHQALAATAAPMFARIWNGRAPQDPLGVAVVDWTQERGGGWHRWRCGADSAGVRARLMQPNRNLRLFICGDVLAQRAGWIESALENVESMLERCFGAHMPIGDGRPLTFASMEKER